MSHSRILITVSGKDRPGMVSRLANIVSSHGGNWMESRMANLGGQFAGILRVDIDASKQAALLADLQALDTQHQMHASMLPVEDSTVQSTGHDVTLDLLGPDHHGIVRDISRVLSENGVSVQAFDSHLEEASMAGGVLFHANARLRLPEHMSTDQLHDQLQALSDSLMVDIELLDVIS